MKAGICDILRERMMAYIEPRNQSVRWLSQRVALPYRSVSRIINRETHICSFRNAYQILKVVAPSESRQILIENFTSFALLIKNDKNLIENISRVDKSLALTLQTKMLYQVHSMASTTLGTSRVEVKNTFGRAGVEALNTLLDDEILAESQDGLIKDLLRDVMHTNEDQIRQMVRYNLDSFQADDKFSGIVNIVEGYSDQGAELACRVIKEAFAKLLEVQKVPANLGHRRLFASIVFGQFDVQLNKAKEGQDQQAGRPVRNNYFRDRYKLDSRAAGAVAGLIHDMRGPFEHVVGFLEAQENSPEKSDELNRAKNAACRVELMIDALRRMKGEEIVARQNESFYLDSILDLADCFSWDHKKEFTFSGQKEFEGYIDSEKLDRCLQNLLTNAFEAARSKVRLECTRDRDSIRFAVIDDGPGVPDEAVLKLFSRGFTLGKEDGTGLGLANVRAVAEGHQGEARYERKEGFTVFTVILRNVFPDADLETAPQQSVDTLDESAEYSEIREGYFSEALQDKPVLFLSCQNAELLVSLRSAAETQIPVYHISTNACDLSRAWVVCVDETALALQASESEVHCVWSPESQLMAHPAFMSSLVRLAGKQLAAFLAKKEEWLGVFRHLELEHV